MSNFIFVRAVGTFDHNSIHVRKGKSDHVIISLDIGNNSVYEIDINVGPEFGQNENQYAIISRQTNSFPHTNGIKQSYFNYKHDLDLSNSDFVSASEQKLANKIIGIAKNADRIMVYGTE